MHTFVNFKVSNNTISGFTDINVEKSKYGYQAKNT